MSALWLIKYFRLAVFVNNIIFYGWRAIIIDIYSSSIPFERIMGNSIIRNKRRTRSDINAPFTINIWILTLIFLRKPRHSFQTILQNDLKVFLSLYI